MAMSSYRSNTILPPIKIQLWYRRVNNVTYIVSVLVRMSTFIIVRKWCSIGNYTQVCYTDVRCLVFFCFFFFCICYYKTFYIPGSSDCFCSVCLSVPFDITFEQSETETFGMYTYLLFPFKSHQCLWNYCLDIFSKTTFEFCRRWGHIVSETHFVYQFCCQYHHYANQ